MDLLGMMLVGLYREFTVTQRSLGWWAAALVVQTAIYIIWRFAQPVSVEDGRFVQYLLCTAVVSVAIPPMLRLAREVKSGYFQQQCLVCSNPTMLMLGRSLGWTVVGSLYMTSLCVVLLLASGVRLNLPPGTFWLVVVAMVAAWAITLIITSLLIWWRGAGYLGSLLILIIILQPWVLDAAAITNTRGITGSIPGLIPLSRTLFAVQSLLEGNLLWWQMRSAGTVFSLSLNSLVCLLLGAVLFYLSVTVLIKTGRWPRGRSM